MKKRNWLLALAVVAILLLSLLSACAGQQKPQEPSATAAPATQTAPVPTPSPTAPPSLLPEGTNGLPWWNDTVFYEVFVRSFYDRNGDGNGDLQGLISKLDYLNDGDPETTSDLGVRGLWLMPINPSPSYHGYDVTDYTAVNPDYGTLDDMRQLLDEAHQRGIRIIIDLVLNHTSTQHPWFVAARDPNSDKRDYYIWSETDPGYPGPWGQKVWFKSGDAYYYAVFWDQMPDLNYANPAVTKEMDEVTRFWLEEVGVDGFRVDGAKHLLEEGEKQVNTEATHRWFEQWRPFYKSINPNALSVGEVRDNLFAYATYSKGDEFDLVFDFDLARSIINGVNGASGSKIADGLAFSASKFPNGQVATLLTNHDDPRVMTDFGGDVEKAKAAATIYLTAPGVPFIYYGEEIGMQGTKPDERIRTPMQWAGGDGAGFTTGTPWEPVNRDAGEVNAALQAQDANSLLSHYRRLVQLRNEHEALRAGEYVKVKASTGEVFAAIRMTPKETVLILVNMSDEPVTGLTLSASHDSLQGTYGVTPHLGDGVFADLTVDAGAIIDYGPVETLPAHANLVLLLSPKP